MIKQTLTVTLMALATSVAAGAAPLTDLRTELQENGKGEEFAMVRCAAFYLSVLNYAGADKLGADVASQSKATIEKMVYRAADLRAERTSTGGKVVDDVLGVTDMYVARYQSNRESGKDAFKDDTLWQADSDMCSLVRDSLN